MTGNSARFLIADRHRRQHKEHQPMASRIPGLNASAITNAQVTNRDSNTPRIGEHLLSVSDLTMFESNNDKGKIFVGKYIVRESLARAYGIVTVSERSQNITESTLSEAHRADETVGTVWARKSTKQEVDRWNSNVKSVAAAIKGTLFNLLALTKQRGASAEDLKAFENTYAAVGWDMSTAEVTDNDINKLLDATWEGEGALPAQERQELLNMFRSIPIKCTVSRIVKRDSSKKSKDALTQEDIYTATSFSPVSKDELSRKEAILFPEE